MLAAAFMTWKLSDTLSKAMDHLERAKNLYDQHANKYKSSQEVSHGHARTKGCALIQHGPFTMEPSFAMSAGTACTQGGECLPSQGVP